MNMAKTKTYNNHVRGIIAGKTEFSSELVSSGDSSNILQKQFII